MIQPHQAHESSAQYRLVFGAVFAACLPVTTAGWLSPARRHALRNAYPAARTPVAAALAAAHGAAAQVFSLPG